MKETPDNPEIPDRPIARVTLGDDNRVLEEPDDVERRALRNRKEVEDRENALVGVPHRDLKLLLELAALGRYNYQLLSEGENVDDPISYADDLAHAVRNREWYREVGRGILDMDAYEGPEC